MAASRMAPSFLTIVVAWWLDPSELGILSFVLAYYSVLSLFADWSIAYSLQKLIPENVLLTAEIAWTALSVRLSFSALLGVLCWTLDASTHAFRGYGVYLAILLIASSFGIIVCVQNARRNFTISGLLNIAFQVGWITCSLVLVKFGWRVTGPLLGLAASYILFGLPGFLLSSVMRGRVVFLWNVADEMTRFGLWATLAAVLGAIASQSGLLVLAYRVDDAAAGMFRVASTFGMVPAVLGMIVVTPLMPIAKEGLLQGGDISGNLLLPILRYLLMLGLPLAVTAGVLAPAIIDLMATSSYSGAALPMRVCLVGNVFLMVVTAFSGILFVGDGLRTLAKIHATVAVIAMSGSIALARHFGATGVAIASLAAWSAGALLMYRWFLRRFAIELEWRNYLRYIGSSLMTGGLVFLATRAMIPSWVRCLVGPSVAFVAYPAFLWLQRDPDLLHFRTALKQYRSAVALSGTPARISR
jgi:O-antigen/teichoic acid export membrane protein